MQEATPEDREQRQNHSRGEVNERGNARLQERITWTTTSGRSQQQAEEHSQQQGRKAQPTARQKSIPKSRREQHSQQQARRAYPKAGEKSIPNSRRESKERKGQCQLQGETYEENSVSKKVVGPMTRNKAAESHQRMAAETTEGAVNSCRSLKKPGRLQRRFPKNEKHEMEGEIEKVVKAQKEARSAAEVADREEHIAHNKESRATSSRRRTRRNTSRKWKLNSRRFVMTSALSWTRASSHRREGPQEPNAICKGRPREHPV